MSRCNTQTKSRTWPKPAIWLWLGHKFNKTNQKIKFANAQRVIGQRKVFFFCLAFSVELGMKDSNKTKRHTKIPHGQPEIWYHLIVGWVPIFREVRGKSIGGDLDVDDEGSEQRPEPLQSLHHGSVGYQPVRTRIGLAKKAYPCKCNREHEQEQRRCNLNCG